MLYFFKLPFEPFQFLKLKLDLFLFKFLGIELFYLDSLLFDLIVEISFEHLVIGIQLFQIRI